MRKFIVIIMLLSLLTGCINKQGIDEVKDKYPLSVEQVNEYDRQIKTLLMEKSWIPDEVISYYLSELPIGVKNTYYEEIIDKAKDAGYDIEGYLGQSVVDGVVNISYEDGENAGVAHIFIAQDEIVGGYYLRGNYIYSLNEKEIMKREIQWQRVENEKITYNYEGKEINIDGSLFYWGKYSNETTYVCYMLNNKLLFFTIGKDINIKKEISLEGLKLTSMFLKDIDNNGISELGLLLSNGDIENEDTLSKLVIYNIEEDLKELYSKDFNSPMWSIDYDGENIIATSKDTIEMYSIKKEGLSKIYSYNKIGGTLKIDDIDQNGSLEYILLDSEGKDIYIFDKNKGLEEIWRSYNEKPLYDNKLQIGDLNHDGVKEIFLTKKDGSMSKIILQRQGFVEVNNISKGHEFFIGDFNGDDSYEYFDFFKNPKIKKYSLIYMY